MPKDLVQITIGQNDGFSKTRLNVWVRPEDQITFDQMFNKNVKIEAEKMAKDLTVTYIHTAIENGLNFLLKLK